MDGGLQALGHEPPSHANDGREADIQSLDDLLISAAGSARRFVAQEQDPRMDQLSCRGLARGHHPIQCLTLLDGQGHLVLLHRGTPSLGPESSHGLKESRSHLTCQLKMDGTLVPRPPNQLPPGTWFGGYGGAGVPLRHSTDQRQPRSRAGLRPGACRRPPRGGSRGGHRARPSRGGRLAPSRHWRSSAARALRSRPAS
jgi:hypothetical protein